MSLLTSITNRAQYALSANISDPNADAYVKQRAAEAANAAAAANAAKDAAAAKAAKDAADAAAKKAAEDKAASLSARSKFDIKKLIGQTSFGILGWFIALLLICFALYGGCLAANESIGYNVPFRILSFFYGMIFFIYYIIKSFYIVDWKGEKIPYVMLKMNKPMRLKKL